MCKKVSIIIPTYKRPVYLPRALNSVINTKYPNLEIIVVDDNSEGDECRIETEVVMEKFLNKYDFIKYEKHKINKNGSAARNTGIKVCTGDYIMFLDDDDEFYEDKISAQVEFMETHDHTWGACYTKYYDVNDNKIVAMGMEKQEGNLLVNELARNLFVHAGSNLMVRREVVEEINGFDESFLRNQDVEFLVRILKKYKLGYVDVLGLAVHVHPRKYKVSFFDLSEQYIDRFKEDIEELSQSDKQAVYRMIGLQQIRHAYEKKEFGRVSKIKKDYNVSNVDIIKYFIHLSKRLITHKAYGYPMTNLYRG